MNSRFCSSVPHCRIVGPTRVSPKKSARMGATARANSSFNTTCSISDNPLPPYSVGHEAQIQPPWRSLWTQSALNASRSGPVSSKPGSNQPGGRFSSSQLRTSVRSASASGGYVRSMR